MLRSSRLLLVWLGNSYVPKRHLLLGSDLKPLLLLRIKVKPLLLQLLRGDLNPLLLLRSDLEHVLLRSHLKHVLLRSRLEHVLLLRSHLEHVLRGHLKHVLRSDLKHVLLLLRSRLKHLPRSGLKYLLRSSALKHVIKLASGALLARSYLKEHAELFLRLGLGGLRRSLQHVTRFVLGLEQVTCLVLGHRHWEGWSPVSETRSRRPTRRRGGASPVSETPRP